MGAERYYDSRGMKQPRVLRSPDEFRAACDEARSAGQRVGFVPTMGALHDGHLALVALAREKCDFVTASIFVNPTQFGPNEDFSRYPRDLDGDVAKLASAGADAVFAPDARAMYPAGEETRVHVGALAEPLCGRFRPGHFAGVTTVVAKLFALVGSSVAVFGKKDYQQLKILERMAKDLFFPVEIVGHSIVREADGVAMSSRNAYLSAEQRLRARGLSRALIKAAAAFDAGERDAGALRSLARAEVISTADKIDYVEVVDPETLVPGVEGATVGDRALVAIACYVGATRLIDNAVLGTSDVPREGAT